MVQWKHEAWRVKLHSDFKGEFDALPEKVRVALLAHAQMLAEGGPHLGRELVDTLNGSAYRNMKELRFNADRGVWRVAFAFDSRQEAVLLACVNKAGKKPQKLYRKLIATADRRFRKHQRQLEEGV